MRMKLTGRSMPRTTLLLMLLGGLGAAQAQDKSAYSCSGNLFTDAAGAQAARAQGRKCEAIPDVPVTIPQGPRPRAAVPAAAAPAPPRPGTAAAASAPGAERVAPQQQHERDNDARAILQAELQREQARLQRLLAEYNDGQPERLGHERNHQRYLDRVAALKASIERSSADIAALQRELSRVSRP